MTTEKRRAQWRKFAARKRATDPQYKRDINNAYYSRNKEKVKARNKDYYYATVDDRRAAAKCYRKANSDAVKDRRLRSCYGIGLTEYRELLAQQKGRCAICLTKNTGRWKYMVVDHCHKSGRVRGLLCNTCNRALGLFRDCTRRLRRATEYLTKERKS